MISGYPYAIKTLESVHYQLYGNEGKVCLLFVGPPLTSSQLPLPPISADGSNQPDVEGVVGHHLAAHKPRLG